MWGHALLSCPTGGESRPSAALLPGKSSPCLSDLITASLCYLADSPTVPRPYPGSGSQRPRSVLLLCVPVECSPSECSCSVRPERVFL